MDSLIPDPDNAGGGSMKRFTFFLVLALFSVSLFAGGQTEAEKVVVYVYDSFAAEWGPGPEIAKRFQEETGYELEFVVCEDGGSVLSRAILERANPQADVLLGIDNFLAHKAKKAGVLAPYNAKVVSGSKLAYVEVLRDFNLTPYDYGYFTLMYDSKSKVAKPSSFKDLVKKDYEKTLVVMDPRTSTPGLGFLTWVSAVYGNDSLKFWKDLKPSILTMTPGWSAGYGLFTSGEAPLVVSYTTSMAYHVKYDKTDRYQALIFPEGHILQVEGVGLVKGAKNPKGAKAFIDFMVSKSAQEVLPETQWMYPVLDSVSLPKSFESIPLPKKVLEFTEDPSSGIDKVINLLAK